MVFYGTLGGSCMEKETIRALFRAGMTGARLNLSHAPLEAFAGLLSDFWEEAEAERVKAEAENVQAEVEIEQAEGSLPRLVIDLQGPELRVGRLLQPVPLHTDGEAALIRDGGSSPLVREAGEAYPEGKADKMELPSIPVPPTVLEAVRAGDRVSLDDSALLLEVRETGPEGALCRVVQGGTLHSRKSLAVLGKNIPLPPLTEEDRRNLSQAARFGVTDILQPFVRGREDVEVLREALDGLGLSHVRIMAKIENRQGLERVEEIASAASELCIARGDLGNGLPLWEVPRYQKRIAAVCRSLGRPFCVATQLLWSMQARPVPTRAEMCDIYNAVLDGASGLMLTGETAAGRYPAEAMGYLVRAARTAVEDLEVARDRRNA